MNNKPHVRLVDPHPKRNRRAHHPRLIPQKRLLIRRPLLRLQPRMIRHRRYPLRTQRRRDRLRRLPRLHIHDPRIIRPLSNELIHLPRRLILRQNRVTQIGPIKTRQINLRLLQPQLLHNITPHLLRRRRRQRQKSHPWQMLPELRQLPILRPKIMPPLTDAMRLIHRDRRHVPLTQLPQKTLRHDPLRRRIQQLVVPLHQPRPSPTRLRPLNRRIQQCRRHPARRQRIHLILHQRDQWRHHQRHPLPSQRRQLKTQRLPRPCRQNRHHIPTRQCRIHDLPLKRAKRIISKILFQQRGQTTGRHAATYNQNHCSIKQ